MAAMSESDKHVIASPYAAQHVPDQDMYSMFQHTFNTKANETALVDTDTGRSLTFRQCEEIILAIARHLATHGMCAGSRLALCCTNSVHYPLYMAAVLRLGGVAVGINHILTPGDIRKQCDLSGCGIIVTGGDITSKVLQAVANTHIKVYTMDDCHNSSKHMTTIADILSDTDNTHRPLPTLHDLHIKPRSDVGFILFSSGTTGFPKPVALSHHGMLAISYGLAHREVAVVSGRQVVFQPMCHVFGMNLISLTFLFGVTTYVMTRFNLEKYISLVAQYRVSTIHVVPPVAVLLSKSPLLEKYDITCIRDVSSGAGPIGGDTEALLLSRLTPPVRFRQVYGMTETTGIITLTPTADHRLAHVPRGSVGLLAPNTQAKVVDVMTGETLGPHSAGEIYVRGPQVMLGYEGQPGATSGILDSRAWLRTGDIGKYDDNGFFFITDRIKELIKYKGYQVAPVELEQVLVTHPAVQDAAVFSLPDQLVGELPRAWVVLKPGAAITEQQLLHFMHGRVAAYKKLRGGIRFVPEIPRSASGKILRRVMKEADINNSTGKATSKL